MSDEIYALKLHEIEPLRLGDRTIIVARVPGGWLYEGVFVPLNPEFKKIERPVIRTDEWRVIDPYETPMCFERILLSGEDDDRSDYVGEGYFCPSEYDGDDMWHLANGETINPTHWMPMPSPPKEAPND